MNITENNKLIADFLSNEVKLYEDCNFIKKAVNKIESLGYWLNRINGDVWIVDNEGKTVINNPTHEDSNAIYLIVVDFIKWYNDTQNAS